MANWVEVNWDELNQPRHETIRGVEVTVYFSPYDMPEAVKGDYDKAKERFAIRFRYLGGDEPIEVRARDRDEYVQLGIGKKTQRLYEILVDVKKLEANMVMLEMREERCALENAVADKVKQAITSFSSTTTTPAPTDNYEAASEALDQQRERVYSGLAAV